MNVYKRTAEFTFEPETPNGYELAVDLRIDYARSRYSLLRSGDMPSKDRCILLSEFPFGVNFDGLHQAIISAIDFAESEMRSARDAGETEE